MSASSQTPLERVRQLAMALPNVSERLSHGEPTFFINEKRSFVMTVDSHHGDGIVGIWCAAAPGEQEARISEDPLVYFRPPYVGHRGWLGVRLDTNPPLDQLTLAEIVEEAWCLIAPRKLVAGYFDSKPS